MKEKYDNFESAFEELKKIVNYFENNDNIKIEDLLKNYESGMNAYSFCVNKLNEAQKKIKTIDSNYE